MTVPDLATDSLYPTEVLTTDLAVDANSQTNVVRFSQRVRKFFNSLTPSGATVYDTGWVGSGVATALAGVTVSGQTFRRVGSGVWFDLSLTATVAYTVPTSGDISNSIYQVQLAAAWTPSTPGTPTQGVGSNGSTGRVLSGAVTGSGVIYVGAVAGTNNIAVGDTLRLAGSYLL